MKKPAFLWLDLETTGLDHTAPRGGILELYAVATDERLQQVGEDLYLLLDRSALGRISIEPDAMAMHVASGLLEDIVNNGIEARKVLHDREFAEHFAGWARRAGAHRETRIAGSSVWFDRAWLYQTSADRPAISHRLFDVSTLIETQCLIGDGYDEPESGHRARDDVYRSIGIAEHLLRAFELGPRFPQGAHICTACGGRGRARYAIDPNEWCPRCEGVGGLP